MVYADDSNGKELTIDKEIKEKEILNEFADVIDM
jgi:hypothetical protein